MARLRDKVLYAHGELPDTFIEKFVSRKAFIYMMEILAAVTAVTFLRQWLPPYFVMFIDNQAGKSALQKGYGSDQRVNAIITAFWALVSHEAWFRHFNMSEASSTSATLSAADMTRLSLQPWVGKRWRSTPLISYKAWRSFPEIPMAPFRVCPKTCWQLEGYRAGWVMCTVWKRTCTTT